MSQAFEPENCSGGDHGSEITRRSFIKRTGGATVATLVAWNMASNSVSAEEEGLSESGSASWKMDLSLAMPELSNYSIAINDVVVAMNDADYTLRMAIEGVWTTPFLESPTEGMNRFEYHAIFRATVASRVGTTGPFTEEFSQDCVFGVVVECDASSGSLTAGYIQIDSEGNPIDPMVLPNRIHELTIDGYDFLFDWNVMGSTIPLQGGETTLEVIFESNAQLSNSSDSLMVLPTTGQNSMITTEWESYLSDE